MAIDGTARIRAMVERELEQNPDAIVVDGVVYDNSGYSRNRYMNGTAGEQWELHIRENLKELFDSYAEAVQDAGRLVTKAGFAVFCGMGMNKLERILEEESGAGDYVNAYLEEEAIQSGVSGKNAAWHVHYANNRLGYRDQRNFHVEGGRQTALSDKSTEELLEELQKLRGAITEADYELIEEDGYED